MVDTVSLHLNGHRDLFRACQVISIPLCCNIDHEFICTFLQAFLDRYFSSLLVDLEVFLEALLAFLGGNEFKGELAFCLAYIDRLRSLDRLCLFPVRCQNVQHKDSKVDTCGTFDRTCRNLYFGSYDW